jgi:Protein of unknown function (DUF1360)
MTKHWLLFVIYALCCYRLSVLVTLDSITASLRARCERWSRQHHHKLVETLVNCTWCVSVWIGGGVVVLARFAGSWAVYPCAAFAFSAVAGFLSERE